MVTYKSLKVDIVFRKSVEHFLFYSMRRTSI